LGEHATPCVICRGAEADAELFRVQVWENDLWRLTTSILAEVPGFSYLEPKRHIPHVTDLDGPEAVTLGSVLAATTRALKDETAAELSRCTCLAEASCTCTSIWHHIVRTTR
jgi:diadenosine tetraphosphate (Ap4A) HIT family hydrolase